MAQRRIRLRGVGPQIEGKYWESESLLRIGRYEHLEIVLNDASISRRHGELAASDQGWIVRDLGSTNGTYVNGKPIKQQVLRNGDMVEMGKYRIRFLLDAPASGYDRGAGFSNSAFTLDRQGGVTAPQSRPAPLAGSGGVVRVVTGPAAGREVALTKVVTTLGKPGVVVASITRRHHSFVLAHVDGTQKPLLNGSAIGAEPMPLKSGDRIALAGAEMEFVQG